MKADLVNSQKHQHDITETSQGLGAVEAAAEHVHAHAAGVHVHLQNGGDCSTSSTTEEAICSLPQGRAPPSAPRHTAQALQQTSGGWSATLRSSSSSQFLPTFAQTATYGAADSSCSHHSGLLSIGQLCAPVHGYATSSGKAPQSLSALLSVASTTAGALRIIAGKPSPLVFHAKSTLVGLTEWECIDSAYSRCLNNHFRPHSLPVSNHIQRTFPTLCEHRLDAHVCKPRAQWRKPLP